MHLQQDSLAIHSASASRPVVDPTRAYYQHASAPRTNTDAYMVKALREAYKPMLVTAIPSRGPMGPTAVGSLLNFANATGKASYEAITDESDPLSVPLSWRMYAPPARRLDGQYGAVLNDVKYGKYLYKYRGEEWILYIADERDGNASFPQISGQYLIHSPAAATAVSVDVLIRDAGKWNGQLHDEIWVFDQGFWRKDADLYRSVLKARWKDVILDENDKVALQRDVNQFFDSRKRYEKLRVAWKRGVIYHGPPGNGKTISIRATMHTLYSRPDPVPTMYVRSFKSFAGPEASIRTIFAQARAEAPCLLVFEDLDSLVTDSVRSYFLNEVDGLGANDGIMMIGSTNHLDQLDPGLSKRPSRFDRKFYFPDPNFDQRVAYAEYWRGKLDKSDGIEFPKALCPEIARITDGFSFAYMQEAFVATLLAIASREGDEDDDGSDEDTKDKFDHLILWREMKKQVKNLKEQM